jgi:hypothetical protein
VRARFEKFPATVKGAFILRGEDRDPHQVVFKQVRVVGVAGQGDQPIQVAADTLDVAPKHDVFVPFELGVTELEPGWYGFECEVDVDGVRHTYPGGRRFAVAWPRATVRRGTVRVDKRVRLGAMTVRVEQVECGGDSIRLSLVLDPPGPLTVRLSAGGARVEVLELELDDATGRGKVTAYPLMRTDAALHIELKGRDRAAKALDVKLP